MAWRITDNVIRGELDNRTRGSIHGKVWIMGSSDPLLLELKGNCHKDLAGCRILFSNPAPKLDARITLASDQTGEAGDMTAARKVRVTENFDALTMDDDLEMKKGKKFPEPIANCLYLEWFSRINGRVVIEATDYEITISQPAWQMSPEEESQQHQANADAMRSFIERAAGPPDPREEAAYAGEPKDEFEWELFLRASDRRGTKLGELMEKYSDDPNRDRLIAQEMGWSHIVEMLDAEAASDEDSDSADEFEDGEPDLEESEELDPSYIRDFRIRHPLVTHLSEQYVTLYHAVGDQNDDDLQEMVGSFMTVGPKIAGALSLVSGGRNSDGEYDGLVVAKLKRAMAELSRALNFADRLKQRNYPFPVDQWVSEMLYVRQEMLSLMDQFRTRPPDLDP